jgi:hypothetical protein
MAAFGVRQGYKASTVLASVQVMKAMIQWSDGNVTIQTKNYPHPADPDGVTEEVRLYCEKCLASKHFEFSKMLNEPLLLEELDWAKGHKHSDGKTIHIEQDTPVNLETNRKLKVVL